MRNRLSAEEWAELVREWEKSAQSARMFADAHGVAEASLRWWKTEFSRRSKKPAAPPSTSPSATRRTSRGPRAVKLARVVRDGEPVPDEEASTRTAGICIVVGYARIVVERGFDAALLRAVIHALGMPT
jgi:transposase-like protein